MNCWSSPSPNRQPRKMKERMTGAIQTAINEAQSQEQYLHLIKQLSLMPQANISTIHAFCLKGHPTLLLPDRSGSGLPFVGGHDRSRTAERGRLGRGQGGTLRGASYALQVSGQGLFEGPQRRRSDEADLLTLRLFRARTRSLTDGWIPCRLCTTPKTD